jgi:hypothetical protein
VRNEAAVAGAQATGTRMHKEREEERREKRRENEKRTRRLRERWKVDLSLGHCGVRGERAEGRSQV